MISTVENIFYDPGKNALSGFWILDSGYSLNFHLVKQIVQTFRTNR
jgi:hypothetical protein